MTKSSKPAGSHTVADYRQWPVWEFAKSDGPHETDSHPVKRLPVRHLAGRFIGLQVRLANGKLVWASLGNVDVNSERRTRHFLLLSIHRARRWFHLARYFDIGRASRGPEALAEFLNLAVAEVFPIKYDLTKYVVGDDGILKSHVEQEPSERLARKELVKLNVFRPKP
jgi:hypothetical protein